MPKLSSCPQSHQRLATAACGPWHEHHQVLGIKRRIGFWMLVVHLESLQASGKPQSVKRSCSSGRIWIDQTNLPIPKTKANPLCGQAILRHPREPRPDVIGDVNDATFDDSESVHPRDTGSAATGSFLGKQKKRGLTGSPVDMQLDVNRVVDDFRVHEVKFDVASRSATTSAFASLSPRPQRKLGAIARSQPRPVFGASSPSTGPR